MNGGSTEIIVHAIRSEKELTGEEFYEYGELYRVNLDTEKITKCPGGKLYLDDWSTSMLISGNIIYILGGRSYWNEGLQKWFKGKKSVHSRASYIDLGNRTRNAGWKKLSDFRSLYPKTPCAVFKGNLFVFGGNIKQYLQDNTTFTFTESPGEELLSPTGRRRPLWRFLPPPPQPPDTGYTRPAHNHVSYPALVDSENNRILVHYPRICSLYAYYPHHRKWEFLFHIDPWRRLAFFFDDMILFHHHKPTYFEGYDLKTGTILDSPVISPDFPFNLLSSKFDTLFPLPQPGTFCLAAYTPEFVLPNKTHLHFLKFRVVRTLSGQPEIKFISLHKPDLDCNACVTNYVPIVNCEDVVVSSKKDNVVASSKKGNVVASSKKGNVVASSKEGNVAASSKKGNVVGSSKKGVVSSKIIGSCAEACKSGAGISFGTIGL